MRDGPATFAGPRRTETGTSSPPSLRLSSGTRFYAAAVINERLPELGNTLPSVAPPVGNHVGCVIVDRTASVGGHGDAGRHTRTAVGTTELPFDIAVEIEMIASVRD